MGGLTPFVPKTRHPNEKFNQADLRVRVVHVYDKNAAMPRVKLYVLKRLTFPCICHFSQTNCNCAGRITPRNHILKKTLSGTVFV